MVESDSRMARDGENSIRGTAESVNNPICQEDLKIILRKLLLPFRLRI
jgi:hypothetical protein